MILLLSWKHLLQALLRTSHFSPENKPPRVAGGGEGSTYDLRNKKNPSPPSLYSSEGGEGEPIMASCQQFFLGKVHSFSINKILFRKV